MTLSASAREMVLPAGTLLKCTMDEPNLSSATIAVGVAKMNAQGQETTSTAMTRFKSWVNAQTNAPITSTSGV